MSAAKLVRIICFLTDEDMERLGAVAKCAPPLRAPNDQQDLWSRLARYHDDRLRSFAVAVAMKQRANFFEVWGGISGCQHLLALLLDASIARAEIERLTSGAVARAFRI